MNATVGVQTEVERLIQGAWAKRPEWMFNPRCKCHGVPELFYPDGDSGEVGRAKAVCNGTSFEGDRACPFVGACLEHALANNEKHGVWGGTSERDRRKIRRQRARERAQQAAKQVTTYPVRVYKVKKIKRKYTSKKYQRLKRIA